MRVHAATVCTVVPALSYAPAGAREAALARDRLSPPAWGAQHGRARTQPRIIVVTHVTDTYSAALVQCGQGPDPDRPDAGVYTSVKTINAHAGVNSYI